jgi:hypothetical protein
VTSRASPGKEAATAAHGWGRVDGEAGALTGTTVVDEEEGVAVVDSESV